jgi:medium-chain acyl-[acyl-carrier-protein] hydrolase
LDSAAGFLQHLPDPAAQIRLFCFPNAGGGVALLHSWLNGLPAAIQLCPIHLPGRDKRRAETPFVRMNSLVRSVCDALEPFLGLPFALFGHSLGALTAFEVARELRRRSLASPARLFASAHRAPQIPRTLAPIHHLPEPAFIEGLIQRYDAIPAVVLTDKQLMDMFLPALRADLEILETYVYQPDPPLTCPISAFGGVLDSTVAKGQLEAWQQQTDSSFRLQMFPGKHFFLKEARPEVLQVICSDLSLGFETV